MKRLSVLSALILVTLAMAQTKNMPHSKAAQDAQMVAPQLYAYTQDILFGEVWKRPNLTPRDRSLVRKVT